MQHTFSLITALLLAPLAALHAAEPKVLDITAYGAKGDGTTLNTRMIQQAVDACHDAGGGVVRVPKGVFLTGALRLKSGVTLRVEKDAILRGSAKISDYAVETAELHWHEYDMFKTFNVQYLPALIYAEDAERIGLEGSGVIDGQGKADSKIFPNKDDAQRRYPIMIRFEQCRDVKLSGLTLIDPGMVTTFFVRSTDIQIGRVTVRSRGSAKYGNAFVFGPAVAKSPWAIRDGNWKLVQGSAASSEVQLFDLSKDASEANDLSTARTDIRERLQKAHDTLVASMPTPYTRVSSDKALDFIKVTQAGRAKAPEKSK